MITVLKVLIYYGMFLLFPFVRFAFYYLIKSHWFLKKFISLFLGLIFLLGIRARFVEPNVLVTHYTQINTEFEQKIALVSDIHIWLFQGAKHVERLVDKLNTLDVDMVLIAGDFTFEPGINELSDMLAPLVNIKHNTYAVLGNHDVMKPGPNIREELEKVLADSNVILLNNESVVFDDFVLVWLWSHMNDEDNVSMLDSYSITDNVIVLTHNPDTTLAYTNKNVDLTLAGHTHWWQIRIPRLYKYVIPTVWDFDRWLTMEENTELFITAWVWMTDLPMRFLNPPVIDVLVLN